jgi:hypothetical protein
MNPQQKNQILRNLVNEYQARQNEIDRSLDLIETGLFRCPIEAIGDELKTRVKEIQALREERAGIPIALDLLKNLLEAAKREESTANRSYSSEPLYY